MDVFIHSFEPLSAGAEEFVMTKEDQLLDPNQHRSETEEIFICIWTFTRVLIILHKRCLWGLWQYDLWWQMVKNISLLTNKYIVYVQWWIVIWWSLVVCGTCYAAESDVFFQAGSKTRKAATAVSSGPHVNDFIRRHTVYLYIFN